jgi:hypothetical protein
MADFRREVYGRLTPTVAANGVTLYSVTRQWGKITYS